MVEALGLPETRAVAESKKRAVEALRGRARALLEKTPAYRAHERIAPEAVEMDEVELSVAAPKRSVAWEEPVLLRLDVLRWSVAPDGFVAFVPELGIQVVANQAEELARRVEEHIRFAMKREGLAASLWKLSGIQRTRKLELGEEALRAKIKSPVEAADDSGREKDEESILEKSATELKPDRLESAFEVGAQVGRLADALGGRAMGSVLLVGPSGCGKTAIVHELVRNRARHRLGGARFWASSGSRLAAGQSGFGMWQEHCRKLVAEAGKKKVVLHLGNLFELMEVGRSEHNQQGVASFLRPYVARGDVQIIVECAPEQVSVIERADPHLLEALHQIDVAEPDVDAGRLILMSCAERLGGDKEPAITDLGLDALDRLHRRYAAYSAYPGRPLRFLRNVVLDKARKGLGEAGGSGHRGAKRGRSGNDGTPAPGEPVNAAEVTAAFSRETGLPRFMLDDAETLDLEAVRKQFAGNVMGQSEAVDLVVDLMAAVKARLSRPRKPVASLMFIGPTGVGKTEMAKALAEFLFGDKGRMTRFDMSEYNDPLSVQRLIGGVFETEGLLTARVREQPFSVVLLDEFEKADASFHDLLLQVLGEGRLTDAAGRVADFSNAVVIMTSNLGAGSFQKGPAGFVVNNDARNDAREHFSAEVRRFLRPEMFNRIDRIVPFAPLDEETTLAIARREIEQIRRRDGIALRGVELRVSEEAARHLAKDGFDARYGARPLKRTIERELLAPLSDGLNGHPESAGLLAEVDVADSRLTIDLRVAKDADSAPSRVGVSGDSMAAAAARAVELRRDAQRLRSSPLVRRFENQVSFLASLEARAARKSWVNEADAARLEPLPRLRQYLTDLDEALEEVAEVEESFVSAIHNRDCVADDAALRLRSKGLRDGLRQLRRRACWLGEDNPDCITLALHGEDREAVWRLGRAYFGLCGKLEFAVDAHQVVPCDGRTAALEGGDIVFDTEPPLRARRIEDGRTFFEELPAGTQGVILGVQGFLAWPRLRQEGGAHDFCAQKDRTLRCHVHVGNVKPADFKLPDGFGRRAPRERGKARRTIDEIKQRLSDAALDEVETLGGRSDIEILDACTEALLERAVAESLS